MSILERERENIRRERYNNVCPILYFLGLSIRDTSSKAIQPLFEEKGRRSHVAIWKWVQRLNPKHVYCCKRVSAFLIDETMVVQIGSADEAWLWIATIEPIHKQILGVYISRHRNMIVALKYS
jgi:transposase-like protein